TAFQFMHVGDSEPQIIGLSGHPLSAMQVVQGPVEETILRVAQERHADMIAMPTAGRDGFLDAQYDGTSLQASTLPSARDTNRLTALSVIALQLRLLGDDWLTRLNESGRRVSAACRVSYATPCR